MIVWLALLVCLIGLAVFFIAEKPKVVEAGKLAYFAGMLATLLPTATKLIDVFGK